MDDWPEPVDHLPLFTIYNLAMVSDWLDEKGEVSVYVSTLVDQGVDLLYLIRSLHDLKQLLCEYDDWYAIAFTAARLPQFALRGVADTTLLEEALTLFPDGHHFYVAEYTYYPDECADIDGGTTHARLVSILADSWSYPLLLASHELWIAPRQPDDTTNILEVIAKRDLTIERSHESYAPYDANPTRYQWIVDMWRE